MGCAEHKREERIFARIVTELEGGEILHLLHVRGEGDEVQGKPKVLSVVFSRISI